MQCPLSAAQGREQNPRAVVGRQVVRAGVLTGGRPAMLCTAPAAQAGVKVAADVAQPAIKAAEPTLQVSGRAAPLAGWLGAGGLTGRHSTLGTGVWGLLIACRWHSGWQLGRTMRVLWVGGCVGGWVGGCVSEGQHSLSESRPATPRPPPTPTPTPAPSPGCRARARRSAARSTPPPLLPPPRWPRR